MTHVVVVHVRAGAVLAVVVFGGEALGHGGDQRA